LKILTKLFEIFCPLHEKPPSWKDQLGLLGSSLIFLWLSDDWRSKNRAETYTRLGTVPQRVIMSDALKLTPYLQPYTSKTYWTIALKLTV
jgi:hypothetical protein